MRISTPIAVVAAGALALSLSGCFGNPVEQIVGGVVEDQIENATGIDVDAGDGATVPADFPSDLPMPDGTLIASLAIDGTFILDFEVSDDTAGARFAQQFTDAGWTQEATADQGQFKTWVFSQGDRAVTISQFSSEDTATRLTYGVAPRT